MIDPCATLRAWVQSLLHPAPALLPEYHTMPLVLQVSPW